MTKGLGLEIYSPCHKAAQTYQAETGKIIYYMKAAIVKPGLLPSLVCHSGDQHTVSKFTLNECAQALAKSLL